MLRIISANLNGIRSAIRKGFFLWLEKQQADFVCVQELKAQHDDLLPGYTFSLCGLRGWFQCAERKGYSGVGIYARYSPDKVSFSFGVDEFDQEGRYVGLFFGKLAIISAYFPSGSSSPERQNVKFRFLSAIDQHLKKLFQDGFEVILCADVNIAHKPIDIKNWKGNVNNSGFLPEERAWLSQLFEEDRYVDVFRRLDARPDQFTWWSQRGQAYANNVGWRIDYQISTFSLALKARRCEIYKGEKFSDHAPLIVDYDLDIQNHHLTR